MGMIPNYKIDWTPEDVAKGIQDYLICVEMFAAAVVHTFVFPHSEYSIASVDARLRALNSAKPSRLAGEHVVGRKRLGRHKLHGQHFYTRYWKESHNDDSSSKNSNLTVEMKPLDIGLGQEILDSNLYDSNPTVSNADIVEKTNGLWQDPLVLTSPPLVLQENQQKHRERTSSLSTGVFSSSEEKQTSSLESADAIASSSERIAPRRTKSSDVSPLNNLPTITTSVMEQPLSLKEALSISSTKPLDTLLVTKTDRGHDAIETTNGNEMMTNRLNSDLLQMYEDHNSDNETEYVDEEFDEERIGHYSKREEHVIMPSVQSSSPSRRGEGFGSVPVNRPGFVSALIDSMTPRDLRDSTVGIVTGEYSVEKKTLLHHAATSDQYDLFSNRRRVAKQQKDYERLHHR
jgi:Organic solute transporter Ostalpha